MRVIFLVFSLCVSLSVSLSVFLYATYLNAPSKNTVARHGNAYLLAEQLPLRPRSDQNLKELISFVLCRDAVIFRDVLQQTVTEDTCPL